MEALEFRFKADGYVSGRAHVGVVASGDLEVLMEGTPEDESLVLIRTSISSYERVWEATVSRFCQRCGAALRIEINDFGATPGMVLLRLQQAFDTLVSAPGKAGGPHG